MAASPAQPPGVARGVVRENLEVVCFAVLLILFSRTFVERRLRSQPEEDRAGNVIASALASGIG